MKDLPYFKFFPAEWLKGDITLCSQSAQGLFINICVYYWMKGCNMRLTGVQHRFNTCSTELEELFNTNIISVEHDNIHIDFLDEQLNEFIELAEKKSHAGRISAKKRKVNTRSTPVQHVMNNIREDKDKDKDINISFILFWNAYNKKVGNKEKIETKWKKLKDEDRKKIMEHVPKYVMATPDKKYRKNPETYLNNKSWNDEIIKQKTLEDGNRKDSSDWPD